VAAVLGLDLSIGPGLAFDVLIVGGGPAGIAAGLYAGAEGLSALVVDELSIGGQAGTSSRIDNYMGFPTGISGADLCWRGEVQALKFGTRFAVPRRIQTVVPQPDGGFLATLDDGCTVAARSLVIAAGVQYRRLPLDRLEDLEGAGVYYAATEIEARFCQGSDVVVVGGGNSAGQAAMFLSRRARRVHMLVRGESLAASMSDYLIGRLQRNPAVDIRYGAELAALHGEDHLEAVTIRDRRSGAEETVAARGAFVMVGAAPDTGWLGELVALDRSGFVVTGAADGSPYATSRPGVFAVGDVRAGSTKRVASAVGEGSVVVSHVWTHLNR
jgi:thioredoxin reductase (NADPH)